MARSARPRPTIGTRIQDTNTSIQELYTLVQQRSTPQSIALPHLGAASPDHENVAQGFLKTAGDTMIGPIAYFPNSTTIASDAIDIGETTDKHTSYIIIDAEGAGTTDDLATITGAKHSGQMLYIQAVSTDTITIKIRDPV